MPKGYVGVTTDGKIYSTFNGTNWTLQSTGLIDSLACVAYSGTMWVAGGYDTAGPHGRLAWSTDAVVWHDVGLATDYRISGIAWNGSRWAASDALGSIYMSDDGMSWTLTDHSVLDVGGFIDTLKAGSSVFVAVGNGGSDDALILTSRGGPWALATPPTGWNEVVDAAIFSAFVALGNRDSGTTEVLGYSADGVTWTEVQVSDANFVTSNDVLAVAPGAAFTTSPDGLVWTDQSATADGTPTCLAYGTAWLGIGWNSGAHTTHYFTSPDGISWSSAAAANYMPIVGLAYGDIPAQFLANAITSTPRSSSFTADAILTTVATVYVVGGDHYNGITSQVSLITSGINVATGWTPAYFTLTSGATSIAGIANANNFWVAVCLDDTVMTSLDGQTWTEHDNALPSGFQADHIIFAGGQFVASGLVSGICTSPDGLVWTLRWSPGAANKQISDIAYGGALYVAVGKYTISFGNTVALMLTSSDGYSWTETDNSPASWTQGITHIAYGNNTWVIIGSNSFSTGPRLTAYSSNTTSWTTGTITITSSAFWSMAYGGGVFVIGTLNGKIYKSSDGHTWTSPSLAISSDRIESLYYDTRWMAVTFSNIYTTSGDPQGVWTSVYTTSPTSDNDLVFVTSGQVNLLTHHITADAVLQRAIPLSFTSDSELLGPHLNANAVLLRTGISSSWNVNAVIAYYRPGDINLTNPLARNRHDRSVAHFGTMPATQVFHNDTTVLEDAIRSLWARIVAQEGAGATALVLKQTGSAVLDAITRRAQAGSATASSLLRRLSSGSFTADGFLRLPPIISSFVADASFIPNLSFTANAIIRATSNSSLLGNASLAIRNVASWVADAIKRKITTNSFASDAYFYSTASSAYGAQVLADSPVGYWMLNEASGNFTDSGSGGNAMVVTGSPTRGQNGIPGDIGHDATSFTASNTYASIAAMPTALRLTTWSIDGWVMKLGTIGFKTSLLTEAYPSTIRYMLGGYGDGVSNRMSGGFYDGAWHRVNDSSDLTTNVWTHLAVTWDGTNIRYYRNGVLIGTDFPGAAAPTSINAVYIARGWDATNNPNVRLAHIAIYSGALSLDRINKHVSVGRGWKFTADAVLV